MRMVSFAGRNAREILRDPMNLAFGLAFPLVLMLLLSAIQANIPVPLFEIGRLAPGITVFGLSFMALFTATLVARDRESSFLRRLYTTPMTAKDFMLGYTLPILPMAVAQTAVCYLASLLLGLQFTPNLFLGVLCNLPAAVLYIALGLLCGSALGVKQVGGICGALLTNVSAWLSGIWFDLALVGGAFEKMANALPFVHAVELARAALAGNIAGLFPHLWWVLGYGMAALVLAATLFLRQMKNC